MYSSFLTNLQTNLQTLLEQLAHKCIVLTFLHFQL